MAHTYPIYHNKKGTSMMELIAYVALYGVVMSLLATLVFVIVKAARRVNSQAILNRGCVLMYTEMLSQTVNLNPDTVSEPFYTNENNTINITFQKLYTYNDDGDRVNIRDAYTANNADPTIASYINKPLTITYSYTKGDDSIVFEITDIKNVKSTGKIDLDYGTTITSMTDDSLGNVITIDTQSSFNKYVTFHGRLKFDNKNMEFNFIIPVYVAAA